MLAQLKTVVLIKEVINLATWVSGTSALYGFIVVFKFGGEEKINKIRVKSFQEKQNKKVISWLDLQWTDFNHLFYSTQRIAQTSNQNKINKTETLSHNRPRRDAVSSLKNKSLTSLKGTHKTPDSTSTLKWWHQDGGLLDRVTEHKGKIKMGERTRAAKKCRGIQIWGDKEENLTDVEQTKR